MCRMWHEMIDSRPAARSTEGLGRTRDEEKKMNEPSEPSKPGKSKEGDEAAGSGSPDAPEVQPNDPATATPPIPKGPPTPLDLPDQDGLDLPRTG